MAPEALPRKLTVILHSDVAGYSVLMEQDEDVAHRRVTQCFDLLVSAVERFGGTVLERRGDALLGEFSQPSDCIAAALTFQRSLAERNCGFTDGVCPQLRIGINLGEVILDRGTVWGPGVNLAQRVEQLAEPGGVCVTAAVYDTVSKTLPVHYEDLGERTVKNSTLRAYRVTLDAGGDIAPSFVDTSSPVPGFDGRVAIAVLPLINRSYEADTEYLADGITDDVITRLQRFRTFPVISRSSSFVYQGQAYDLRRIARELGVGYIVLGTLRKRGERLRLTIDLVATTAQVQVTAWSQTYDRNVHDVFEIQDEISLAIVAMLEPEIERAERQRPPPLDADQAQAWHLVRRGLWHQHRLTRADAEEARAYFERALARDPGSVEAHVHLAWWHWWDAATRRGGADDYAAMEEHVQRARALDPHDARAACLSGVAAMMRRRQHEARGLFLEAIELNPSYAQAYSHLGSTYNLTGEPGDAITPIETAMRLSPFDHFIFHAYGELAMAHHMCGSWNEAIAAAEGSLRLRSGYWLAHMVRVASLARAGRNEHARAALEELLRRRPRFGEPDIGWIMFDDPAWNDYLREGLALAGWSGPAERS